MKEYILNDGYRIPEIGFGTYKATEKEGYQVVLDAIRAGYRLLDTAKIYGNEEDVGRAMRESGVPREDFFLTSKLDRNKMGYENAREELQKTLERLGTDYVDLYLLHWPRADYKTADFEDWKRLDIESWRALEEMQKEGKIRSIGVSNFLPHHLENLLENTEVVPAVNQLELHPGYLQSETCEYCKEKGILPEAWSPIGRGRLQNHPLLQVLSEKYHTSVPHLCLAFLHQEGIVVLPKASTPERMQENLRLDDIHISEEDMWLIRTMPQAGWGGEHPDYPRAASQGTGPQTASQGICPQTMSQGTCPPKKSLVLLIGSGAVGKMTVGQELMKITDFRLFHNHHMIEPVIEIFGKFDGAVVSKLREDIFDAFMRTDYSGMIFTFMWAFDMQSDWDYIKSVTDKFEASGGSVYYVELVADRAVRIERNKTENRLKNKASKRDVVVSEDRMLREETKYRLVSKEGEIPFDNYMKIDNTNLEPAEVARMIKKRFNLQGVKSTELMNRVKLEEVRENEIQQLYDMQIQSFMPLYEKYHDEMSPVNEPIEKVRAKALYVNRRYYFIVKDGARVGAINIGSKSSDPEESCFYISPIFILPKYQNQGIAYVAIQKAFSLYPDIKVWKLETILQEPGNCHLYEKCGFVRVGEEHIINDKMTLVDYEKR